MKRLSDPTIERYATPKKETWIFDSGAVGLALKLTPGGRKVWIRREISVRPHSGPFPGDEGGGGSGQG